jgi:hypothetical protein
VRDSLIKVESRSGMHDKLQAATEQSTACQSSVNVAQFKRLISSLEAGPFVVTPHGGSSQKAWDWDLMFSVRPGPCQCSPLTVSCVLPIRSVWQEHVHCTPGQEDWTLSRTKNEVQGGSHSLLILSFKPESRTSESES